MDHETLRQRAKDMIQRNSDSMALLKKRWKEGKLTRDEYIARMRIYQERNYGIQSVFRAA